MAGAGHWGAVSVRSAAVFGLRSMAMVMWSRVLGCCRGTWSWALGCWGSARPRKAQIPALEEMQDQVSCRTFCSSPTEASFPGSLQCRNAGSKSWILPPHPRASPWSEGELKAPSPSKQHPNLAALRAGNPLVLSSLHNSLAPLMEARLQQPSSSPHPPAAPGTISQSICCCLGCMLPSHLCNHNLLIL